LRLSEFLIKGVSGWGSTQTCVNQQLALGGFEDEDDEEYEGERNAVARLTILFYMTYIV